MKDVIRYSEAFKLRVVEDIACGKYKSLEEARRRNGIRGSVTLTKWLKQYGREDNHYSVSDTPPPARRRCVPDIFAVSGSDANH
jgi:transposase-like protein